MKITKISLQKNKIRLNIFLENQYSFSCSKNDLIKFNLYEGLELNLIQFKLLREDCDLSFVYDKALNYILRRAHSKEELRTKLKNKGFLEEVISKVLEKLESKQYLDDKEFVRVWILERKRMKHRSKKELYFELLKKGIKKEIIEEGLSYYQKEDEVLEALEIIKKKNYKKNDDEFKKIYVFLSRKGFSYEVIKESFSLYKPKSSS